MHPTCVDKLKKVKICHCFISSLESPVPLEPAEPWERGTGVSEAHDLIGWILSNGISSLANSVNSLKTVQQELNIS